MCLSRHHITPVKIVIRQGEESEERELAWIAADPGLVAAWANQIDTTEAAAYCVTLASVEDQRQLVAIGRTETGSGADYLLAPAGSPIEYFEDVVRLEVSGTDSGTHAVLQNRLTEKIKQAREAEDSPAIAAVVGFKILTVLIADVTDT